MIVALAIWAGQPPRDGEGGRTIQGLYGLLVAAALGVLILAYAWAHYLVPSLALARRKPEDEGGGFALLGWLFTKADQFLVLDVALLCGAATRQSVSAGARTLRFALYFAIALASAWLWAPPYGLIGVVLGLVGILALNRAWSWVEEDRRNYVLSGHYEVADKSNIGLGFESDYRGVALSSLALLIILMPLALRQMAAFGFFETKDGTPIEALGVFEWFVFFGGEMAKSVPFVDWSEVYGAETVTPIAVVHGGGQHAVFLVRALVDLVLLAGFIQAFELSNRLARQKLNFSDENNPERILDPFLERDAFRDIATFTAPQSPDHLETDLLARLSDRLGAFAAYSTLQLRRVLDFDEAPEFWRPNHEAAVAIMTPYRHGIFNAPKYYIEVIRTGLITPRRGEGRGAARRLHERVWFAASAAALGTTRTGYAEARDAALAKLPDFIASDDPRVWSGAICVAAEVGARADAPDDLAAMFDEILSPEAAARQPRRARLAHRALACLANLQRPTEPDRRGRPYFDAAARLLVGQLGGRYDLNLRSSAVEALAAIDFAPGRALDAAQGALGALADALKPKPWRWTRLLPWSAEGRLRRAALDALSAVSKGERAAV